MAIGLPHCAQGFCLGMVAADVRAMAHSLFLFVMISSMGQDYCRNGFPSRFSWYTQLETFPRQSACEKTSRLKPDDRLSDSDYLAFASITGSRVCSAPSLRR